MHSVTVKNAQVRKLDDLMKTRAVPVRYRTKALHVRASALAEQSPAAASASSGAAPRGYKDAIMLQSFGWDSAGKGGFYKFLQSKVDEMREMNITHVWMPPPSQSVSQQGYMPGQLYNLNSNYGTADDLTTCVAAINAAGMLPVADIVINHRCADELGPDGKWNTFRDDVTHTGRKVDWGKWAITGNDPVFGGTGNPDTGEDYGPAPDLDHLNPELRAALTEWLCHLHDDVGFHGWRLDFVRGYAPKYVREYIAATVGTDVLNVGEYWVDMAWRDSELEANQDKARQRLCDWIDATERACCAFDFPTKGILQEAFKHTQLWRLKDSKGKAPGLLGWWPHRAVTFVANHDTDSTQKHWPFPADRLAAGYAYILTHPGIPCIFCDHIFAAGSELQSKIKALSEVRRSAGIVSDTQLSILAAEADLYVAQIGDSVMLKLGPRYDMGALEPKAANGWKVAVSGKDFCVWQKPSTA